VIIVDDHPPMLEHVARLLEEEFMLVGLFCDAESLLEQWPGAHPDVMVLDISLPGCSGLEAARRLRRNGCQVPIVFLSVHHEPEIMRAARAAGGLGYVAKRVVGQDLAPAIRAALGGRRFISAPLGSR
jgi:DNA-binding NarL/FixJ family response regulator